MNVLVDITERHDAEQALRSAADALAASNAVKDEFLGLVSHELRTPVTTIFGNAQLLQARGAELPDEVRAGMIADIATDADRLHVDHREPAPADTPGVRLATRIASRRSSIGSSKRGVASFQARHPGRTIEVMSTGRTRSSRPMSRC